MSEVVAARPELRRAAPTDGPVAIEVRGLAKTFRVPDQRVDSLKERVTHPLNRVEHRTLHALRDVSFDVHRGEFFGVVGRNGSGKSTLLKVLASIYQLDAGTVRAAGHIAPFIELGVGFNPEMAAEDNILLNGVLLGLSRRESRRRVDAVLEFAELAEFADLKLKNYSSGMMVRLAFATMVQADADIMLVDEVLAVGDAAFAQKCLDVFEERRRAGKTVVLVTHDMNSIQGLCDRAMLIHDGLVEELGDPGDVALQYYRRNFEAAPVIGPSSVELTDAAVGRFPVVARDNAHVVSAQLTDAAGRAIEHVEQGAPLDVEVVLRAGRELDRPELIIHVADPDGLVIAVVERRLDAVVEAGGTMRLAGRLSNPLVPGRYYLDCWVRREGVRGELGVQGMRLLGFTVYGIAPRDGVVFLEGDLDVAGDERS